MRGASRIFCIGAPVQRLETAKSIGAIEVLNFEYHTDSERLAWILDRTDGRGVDVTIEATGAPISVIQAMRFTRDAGRVVVVGQYTDLGDVRFNPHFDLNKKHLEVRGCWGSDFLHFYRAVQVMTDPIRSMPWMLIPLTRYGLRHANKALEDVGSGRVIKALIHPYA